MGSEPTIFLLACLVSLGLTALIREISPRIGLTDDPDGHRKLHGRAIPLGGGVAIYLTTAVILGTLFWIAPAVTSMPSSDDVAAKISSSGQAEVDSEKVPSTPKTDAESLADSEEQSKKSALSEDGDATRQSDNEKPFADTDSAQSLPYKLRKGFDKLPAFLLAGLIIVLVGLVDDWKGMRGKFKLMGQIVAVSVLIAGGLTIRSIDVFGIEISFDAISYPITIYGYEILFQPLVWLVTLFWMLGAINALNLLDGIDGLATILGIILSCTIAAMAVVMTAAHGSNIQGVAIIAMVFAGSLLGFLRFNFPPASIFLGDSGSMLIGLWVGALAIGGSLKASGTVLLAAPLAIWTLPFFDSIAAILRRKLTGRSVYETDRGHLHHRLMNLLGSNRKVLGWVAVCCTVIAIAALIGLIRNHDEITLLTCFGIVAIFVATGIFGRVELLLVGTRLRGFGRHLVSPIFPSRKSAWQTSIHLQGNQQWDLLWATFIESADKLRLVKIRLDVNIPTMAEAYHAFWERSSHVEGSRCWHVEVPLVLNNRPVGLVRITGERNHQSACADIQQLMELIEPFEARLECLSSDLENGTSENNSTEKKNDSKSHSLSSKTTPR